MTERRSAAPLEIAGLILAFLGVFPLAAFIKWAPVVAWLPRAGIEWAISTVAFVAVCYLIARFAGETADRVLQNARNAVLKPTPRDFAIYAGLFTFLASLFVAFFVFGGLPTGGDEMAQRFQARLLAAGRLWGVAEEPYQFFSGIQTVNMDGRWFAQFPIGGALLLAIGTLVGAPWIVNPALAAWTAASVYRFASKITDESTARFATLLFALSPFVLLMSGSQMNHTGALAFLMFAMAALPDWVAASDARALRSAALRIGFGFAMSATIRPYEAAIFGTVVGVFQLLRARRSAPHIRSFMWQLAGGALPIAFLLYVNQQQTGHAMLFGYDALNGSSHRPGFHADPTGVEFTPLQGIHHISSYLLLLNVSLFGAPIPSVVLVAGALMLARGATTWDYLNVTLVLALLAAFACYWAESFFVGPRFLYTGVPFFILFAASLPRLLAAKMQSATSSRAARLLLPLAILVAWVMPPNFTPYQGVWSAFVGERRSDEVRLVNLDEAVRDEGLDDALVIVHESWHGRLTARLRALGAPALTAEAFLREFDACALQIGLDEQDRIGGPPSIQRVQLVARRALIYGDAKIMSGTNGSTTLAFARPLHPYCVQELDVDKGRSASLDLFLANARFDRDGRLAGRVVYARDFGADNARLLGRFGERTWYRYRPPAGPDDHGPVFVPYYGR
jgi:hypothetical protein